MIADRFMDATEAAHRTFFRAEKGAGDLARRIVHRHHQIAIILAKPS